MDGESDAQESKLIAKKEEGNDITRKRLERTVSDLQIKDQQMTLASYIQSEGKSIFKTGEEAENVDNTETVSPKTSSEAIKHEEPLFSSLEEKSLSTIKSEEQQLNVTPRVEQQNMDNLLLEQTEDMGTKQLDQQDTDNLWSVTESETAVKRNLSPEENQQDDSGHIHIGDGISNEPPTGQDKQTGKAIREDDQLQRTPYTEETEKQKIEVDTFINMVTRNTEVAAEKDFTGQTEFTEAEAVELVEEGSEKIRLAGETDGTENIPTEEILENKEDHNLRIFSEPNTQRDLSGSEDAEIVKQVESPTIDLDASITVNKLEQRASLQGQKLETVLHKVKGAVEEKETDSDDSDQVLEKATDEEIESIKKERGDEESDLRNYIVICKNNLEEEVTSEQNSVSVLTISHKDTDSNEKVEAESNPVHEQPEESEQEQERIREQMPRHKDDNSENLQESEFEENDVKKQDQQTVEETTNYRVVQEEDSNIASQLVYNATDSKEIKAVTETLEVGGSQEESKTSLAVNSTEECMSFEEEYQKQCPENSVQGIGSDPLCEEKVSQEIESSKEVADQGGYPKEYSEVLVKDKTNNMIRPVDDSKPECLAVSQHNCSDQKNENMTTEVKESSREEPEASFSATGTEERPVVEKRSQKHNTTIPVHDAPEEGMKESNTYPDTEPAIADEIESNKEEATKEGAAAEEHFPIAIKEQINAEMVTSMQDSNSGLPSSNVVEDIEEKKEHRLLEVEESPNKEPQASTGTNSYEYIVQEEETKMHEYEPKPHYEEHEESRDILESAQDHVAEINQGTKSFQDKKEDQRNYEVKEKPFEEVTPAEGSYSTSEFIYRNNQNSEKKDGTFAVTIEIPKQESKGKAVKESPVIEESQKLEDFLYTEHEKPEESIPETESAPASEPEITKESIEKDNTDERGINRSNRVLVEGRDEARPVEDSISKHQTIGQVIDSYQEEETRNLDRKICTNKELASTVPSTSGQCTIQEGNKQDGTAVPIAGAPEGIQEIESSLVREPENRNGIREKLFQQGDDTKKHQQGTTEEQTFDKASAQEPNSGIESCNEVQGIKENADYTTLEVQESRDEEPRASSPTSKSEEYAISEEETGRHEYNDYVSSPVHESQVEGRQVFETSHERHAEADEESRNYQEESTEEDNDTKERDQSIVEKKRNEEGTKLPKQVKIVESSHSTSQSSYEATDSDEEHDTETEVKKITKEEFEASPIIASKEYPVPQEESQEIEDAPTPQQELPKKSVLEINNALGTEPEIFGDRNKKETTEQECDAERQSQYVTEHKAEELPLEESNSASKLIHKETDLTEEGDTPTSGLKKTPHTKSEASDAVNASEEYFAVDEVNQKYEAAPNIDNELPPTNEEESQTAPLLETEITKGIESSQGESAAEGSDAKKHYRVLTNEKTDNKSTSAEDTDTTPKLIYQEINSQQEVEATISKEKQNSYMEVETSTVINTLEEHAVTEKNISQKQENAPFPASKAPEESILKSEFSPVSEPQVDNEIESNIEEIAEQSGEAKKCDQVTNEEQTNEEATILQDHSLQSISSDVVLDLKELEVKEAVSAVEEIPRKTESSSTANASEECALPEEGHKPVDVLNLKKEISRDSLQENRSVQLRESGINDGIESIQQEIRDEESNPEKYCQVLLDGKIDTKVTREEAEALTNINAPAECAEIKGTSQQKEDAPLSMTEAPKDILESESSQASEPQADNEIESLKEVIVKQDGDAREHDKVTTQEQTNEEATNTYQEDKGITVQEKGNSYEKAEEFSVVNKCAIIKEVSQKQVDAPFANQEAPEEGILQTELGPISEPPLDEIESIREEIEEQGGDAKIGQVTTEEQRKDEGTMQYYNSGSVLSNLVAGLKETTEHTNSELKEIPNEDPEASTAVNKPEEYAVVEGTQEQKLIKLTHEAPIVGNTSKECAVLEGENQKQGDAPIPVWEASEEDIQETKSCVTSECGIDNEIDKINAEVTDAKEHEQVTIDKQSHDEGTPVQDTKSACESSHVVIDLIEEAKYMTLEQQNPTEEPGAYPPMNISAQSTTQEAEAQKHELDEYFFSPVNMGPEEDRQQSESFQDSEQELNEESQNFPEENTSEGNIVKEFDQRLAKEDIYKEVSYVVQSQARVNVTTLEVKEEPEKDFEVCPAVNALEESFAPEEESQKHESVPYQKEESPEQNVQEIGSRSMCFTRISEETESIQEVTHVDSLNKESLMNELDSNQIVEATPSDANASSDGAPKEITLLSSPEESKVRENESQSQESILPPVQDAPEKQIQKSEINTVNGPKIVDETQSIKQKSTEEGGYAKESHETTIREQTDNEVTPVQGPDSGSVLIEEAIKLNEKAEDVTLEVKECLDQEPDTSSRVHKIEEYTVEEEETHEYTDYEDDSYDAHEATQESKKVSESIQEPNPEIKEEILGFKKETLEEDPDFASGLINNSTYLKEKAVKESSQESEPSSAVDASEECMVLHEKVVPKQEHESEEESVKEVKDVSNLECKSAEEYINIPGETANEETDAEKYSQVCIEHKTNNEAVHEVNSTAESQSIYLPTDSENTVETLSKVKSDTYVELKASTAVNTSEKCVVVEEEAQKYKKAPTHREQAPEDEIQEIDSIPPSEVEIDKEHEPIKEENTAEGGKSKNLPKVEIEEQTIDQVMPVQDLGEESINAVICLMEKGDISGVKETPPEEATPSAAINESEEYERKQEENKKHEYDVHASKSVNETPKEATQVFQENQEHEEEINETPNVQVESSDEENIVNKHDQHSVEADTTALELKGKLLESMVFPAVDVAEQCAMPEEESEKLEAISKLEPRSREGSVREILSAQLHEPENTEKVESSQELCTQKGSDEKSCAQVIKEDNIHEEKVETKASEMWESPDQAPNSSTSEIKLEEYALVDKTSQKKEHIPIRVHEAPQESLQESECRPLSDSTLHNEIEGIKTETREGGDAKKHYQVADMKTNKAVFVQDLHFDSTMDYKPTRGNETAECTTSEVEARSSLEPVASSANLSEEIISIQVIEPVNIKGVTSTEEVHKGEASAENNNQLDVNDTRADEFMQAENSSSLPQLDCRKKETNEEGDTMTSEENNGTDVNISATAEEGYHKVECVPMPGQETPEGSTQEIKDAQVNEIEINKEEQSSHEATQETKDVTKVNEVIIDSIEDKLKSDTILDSTSKFIYQSIDSNTKADTTTSEVQENLQVEEESSAVVSSQELRVLKESSQQHETLEGGIEEVDSESSSLIDYKRVVPKAKEETVASADDASLQEEEEASSVGNIPEERTPLEGQQKEIVPSPVLGEQEQEENYEERINIQASEPVIIEGVANIHKSTTDEESAAVNNQHKKGIVATVEEANSQEESEASVRSISEERPILKEDQQKEVVPSPVSRELEETIEKTINLQVPGPVNNEGVASIHKPKTEEESDVANNQEAIYHKIEDEVTPTEDSISASQWDSEKAGINERDRTITLPVNQSSIEPEASTAQKTKEFAIQEQIQKLEGIPRKLHKVPKEIVQETGSIQVQESDAIGSTEEVTIDQNDAKKPEKVLMKDSTEDKVISLHNQEDMMKQVTSFEGPNSPILFLETVDNKDVESIQEATTEEASDANNNQAADHKIEDEVIPMKDSDSASQLNYKKAGTTEKGETIIAPLKKSSVEPEASPTHKTTEEFAVLEQTQNIVDIARQMQTVPKEFVQETGSIQMQESDAIQSIQQVAMQQSDGKKPEEVLIEDSTGDKITSLEGPNSATLDTEKLDNEGIANIQEATTEGSDAILNQETVHHKTEDEFTTKEDSISTFQFDYEKVDTNEKDGTISPPVNENPIKPDASSTKRTTEEFAILEETQKLEDTPRQMHKVSEEIVQEPRSIQELKSNGNENIQQFAIEESDAKKPEEVFMKSNTEDKVDSMEVPISATQNSKTGDSSKAETELEESSLEPDPNPSEEGALQQDSHQQDLPNLANDKPPEQSIQENESILVQEFQGNEESDSLQPHIDEDSNVINVVIEDKTEHEMTPPQHSESASMFGQEATQSNEKAQALTSEEPEASSSVCISDQTAMLDEESKHTEEFSSLVFKEPKEIIEKTKNIKLVSNEESSSTREVTKDEESEAHDDQDAVYDTKDHESCMVKQLQPVRGSYSPFQFDEKDRRDQAETTSVVNEILNVPDTFMVKNVSEDCSMAEGQSRTLDDLLRPLLEAPEKSLQQRESIQLQEGEYDQEVESIQKSVVEPSDDRKYTEALVNNSREDEITYMEDSKSASLLSSQTTDSNAKTETMTPLVKESLQEGAGESTMVDSSEECGSPFKGSQKYEDVPSSMKQTLEASIKTIESIQMHESHTNKEIEIVQQENADEGSDTKTRNQVIVQDIINDQVTIIQQSDTASLLSYKQTDPNERAEPMASDIEANLNKEPEATAAVNITTESPVLEENKQLKDVPRPVLEPPEPGNGEIGIIQVSQPGVDEEIKSMQGEQSQKLEVVLKPVDESTEKSIQSLTNLMPKHEIESELLATEEKNAKEKHPNQYDQVIAEEETYDEVTPVRLLDLASVSSYEARDANKKAETTTSGKKENEEPADNHKNTSAKFAAIDEENQKLEDVLSTIYKAPEGIIQQKESIINHETKINEEKQSTQKGNIEEGSNSNKLNEVTSEKKTEDNISLVNVKPLELSNSTSKLNYKVAYSNEKDENTELKSRSAEEKVAFAVVSATEKCREFEDESKKYEEFPSLEHKTPEESLCEAQSTQVQVYNIKEIEVEIGDDKSGSMQKAEQEQVVKDHGRDSPDEVTVRERHQEAATFIIEEAKEPSRKNEIWEEESYQYQDQTSHSPQITGSQDKVVPLVRLDQNIELSKLSATCGTEAATNEKEGYANEETETKFYNYVGGHKHQPNEKHSSIEPAQTTEDAKPIDKAFQGAESYPNEAMEMIHPEENNFTAAEQQSHVELTSHRDGVENMIIDKGQGSELHERTVSEREEEATVTMESVPNDSAKVSAHKLQKLTGAETGQMAVHLTEEEQPTDNKQREQLRTEDNVESSKSDEENEEEGEEHNSRDEHKGEESGSKSPILIEAPRDIDCKATHKKSHNILSGIKHSFSKVKKAIRGKSSHHKSSSAT
ncbi:hypothetical protein Dimus_018195 [Dionaea muscipula]